MNKSALQQIGILSGRIRRIPSSLWKWEALLRGAEIRGAVEFLGRPILTVAPGSRLVFEGGNRIFSSKRCNPLGNFQPCVLRALASGALLQLGKNVGLSGVAICAAAEISIGEGSIVGSGAMIFDTDFHSPVGEWGWDDDAARNARPVRIGRGCFLGARCIVLKGVTIGDRARIGAGAVVSRDVPAGAVAVGNPARILGGASDESAV